MRFSLVVIGVFGLIAGLSTWFVVKLQRIELSDSAAELEEYKASAKRDTEIAIGSAAADADVKINAAKTEAATKIATLGKDADLLRNEAEQAKLQTERLKQAVAWRTISNEMVEQISAVLKAAPGSVNLRFTDGDPESLFLAIQFSKILTDARWQVATGSEKTNSISFGIHLPDPANGDMMTLRDALSAAKIPFSTEVTPASNTSVGFNISTIRGAPTFMMGSRAPPSVSP